MELASDSTTPGAPAPWYVAAVRRLSVGDVDRLQQVLAYVARRRRGCTCAPADPAAAAVAAWHLDLALMHSVLLAEARLTKRPVVLSAERKSALFAYLVDVVRRIDTVALPRDADPPPCTCQCRRA